MKLKIQLVAFAALAVLAGCGESSEIGAPKQSAAPAVTNEAKAVETVTTPAAPPSAAPAPVAAPTATNSAANTN